MGRLIRWRTGSPYSHVAVFVAGSLYEAVRGGVHRLDGLDAVMRARAAAATVDVHPEADDVLRAVRWLEGQVGCGYSFEEIAGIIVGLVLSRPRHWICSSLVAAALRIAGALTDAELDDRLESPGSLARALGAL